MITMSTSAAVITRDTTKRRAKKEAEQHTPTKPMVRLMRLAASMREKTSRPNCIRA